MSNAIKNISPDLVKRYLKWKKTDFEKNKIWFKRISEEGQKPSTMIISCCDSRINITSIFNANYGEFFIHRNIANLIPHLMLMVIIMVHRQLWNMLYQF